MDNTQLKKVKEKRDYKAILKGGLFLLLILFSITFTLEIPNENVVGDILLINIGLKPWSSDTGGFHIALLYAFAMFLIGYLGVIYYLRNIYPRFIKKLPILLCLFLLIMPYMLSLSYKATLTLSNGIDAIDYISEKSKCDYELAENGYLILDAHLQFHNYSNKDVTFYIKYIPNDTFIETIIDEDILAATLPDTDEQQAFTIPPKTTENLKAYFKAPIITDMTNLKGSSSPFDIILYTDVDERQFIKIP